MSFPACHAMCVMPCVSCHVCHAERSEASQPPCREGVEILPPDKGQDDLQTRQHPASRGDAPAALALAVKPKSKQVLSACVNDRPGRPANNVPCLAQGENGRLQAGTKEGLPAPSGLVPPFPEQFPEDAPQNPSHTLGDDAREERAYRFGEGSLRFFRVLWCLS